MVLPLQHLDRSRLLPPPDTRVTLDPDLIQALTLAFQDQSKYNQMLEEKKLEWEARKEANVGLRAMYDKSCGEEFAATVKKLDLAVLRQLVKDSGHEGTMIVFCIAAGFFNL